jgi:hypothetical protein
VALGASGAAVIGVFRALSVLFVAAIAAPGRVGLHDRTAADRE